MKRFLFVVLLTCSAFAFAQGPGPNFPYTINLSFTASSSPGVTGYFAYRAPYTTSCGTFAKVNTAPFTGTTFVDTTAPMGAWCSAVTAIAPVNGVPTESALSTPATNEVIPPLPPTALNATIGARQSNGTYQVAWEWNQTVSPVSSNRLYCAYPSGPQYLRWTGSKAGTSIKLDMEKGTHDCVAVSVYNSWVSGPSNKVAVTVQ